MDKHDSTEPPRADIARLYCEACDTFRPVQFDAPDIVCKHWLVGNVSVKGLDVGLKQVRAGLAWHYKRFELEQAPEDRTRYAEAENQARMQRIGLWHDTSPTPPWHWRGQQKADITAQ